MTSRHENEEYTEENTSCFDIDSEEYSEEWVVDDLEESGSDDDGWSSDDDWGSDDAFGDGTGTHEDPGSSTPEDPPPGD